MKRNTGKKYIKLHGYEVPTPDSEKRAADFMQWYGDNMDELKYYAKGAGYPVDDDLFSDTMLRVYEAVALRGLQIKDYTGYFLRAYRGVYINSGRKKAIVSVPFSLEKPHDLPAAEFNSAQYEDAVETLNTEVLEYVRGKYDEFSVSLFEMYVGLAPDISYKRLAAMLGVPFVKVWTSIGKVKKGVTTEFRARRDFLLSVVDF